MKRKVIVAMSGGVDSSVAAALLKEAGYEALGITMRLWGDERDSFSAIASAREVCKMVGIEHKVLDIRDSFRNEVIEYFMDEYIAGRTPNPCIRCNEKIKFGVLMKMVDVLRSEQLATGHYARVVLDGRTYGYNLLRGMDAAKDQSYFLCRLNQKQLSQAVFPLGEMTKEQTRDKARALGLPSAERGDSQEVCFIPDDDYRGFIESERPDSVRVGEFVDGQGKVLGTHRGIAFYTIGQRKGLGVSSPLGRRYVLDRDPATNRIVLGDEDELRQQSCMADQLNWVSCIGIDGPVCVDVKLRYSFKPVPATLYPEGDMVRIEFAFPEKGVSPGQSAVFYQGDVVVGGGVVVK